MRKYYECRLQHSLNSATFRKKGMSLSHTDAYQIKDSKTGLKIPVLNGTYIHSQYNPEGESDSTFNRYADKIKKNSNILILGLGYGYHIKKIIEYFKSNNKKYHIVAIEPSKEIARDCIALKQIDFQNINIYSHSLVNELFHIPSLVTFLLKKPLIIPHPTSFNLHRDYFRRYLTYKCTKKVSESEDIMTSEEARNYFILKSNKKQKQENEITTNFEFALMAFEQIGKHPYE